MSWSIAVIGTMSAILAAIEQEAAKQSGQCKAEFDAAKPHLIGLVSQNFNNKPGVSAPILHLEASGSGYTSGGKEHYRQCSASVKYLSARLVTDPVAPPMQGLQTDLGSRTPESAASKG